MQPFTYKEEWYNSLNEILDDLEFKKNKQGLEYANVASVFDIEASSFINHDEKQAVMYAWVFGINGRCIRGRTWQEFIEVINTLGVYYSLTENKRFIIYVHNLAYEFQFIKDLFSWQDVFAVDDRKPLYAITTNGVEFRCSYLLSGYSLVKVGENLTKYKIDKKVGDLDYDLVRFSTTPLTDKEWNYILHDGLVVMCFIKEEIERNGSLLYTPLTSTGYVRKYCRDALFKGHDKYNFFEKRKVMTLTVETYKQLKQTYMGGFTHANIKNVNKVFKDVASFDFTSSYPAVMLSEMFPCSKPHEVERISEEEFNFHIHTHSCMFTARFMNITDKFKYDHYISLSKCLNVVNEISDNGRIVEADEIVIDITEQDYFIIEQCYDWDSIIIYNFKWFNRAYLPKDLIIAVLDLYKDKTTLKGVEGKEAEYLHAKGNLNATYGMSVTDPCKIANKYINGEWTQDETDIAELIKNYNDSRGRFLYYAWGIWITAYARANLWSGILNCGKDYIYSDTDSIKCINYLDHMDYFNKYDKRIKEKVKKCLLYHEIPYTRASPKTIEGKVKPIGVWDFENKGNLYGMFKTLGAKRYIYTQINPKTNVDELHITIAGVGKKSGAKYLMYKYKTFDKVFKNFNNNLTFPAKYFNKDELNIETNTKGKWLSGSGKNSHFYIDDNQSGTFKDYLGNDFTYNEKSGCYIEVCDFTMKLETQFLNAILYGFGFEEDDETERILEE